MYTDHYCGGRQNGCQSIWHFSTLFMFKRSCFSPSCFWPGNRRSWLQEGEGKQHRQRLRRQVQHCPECSSRTRSGSRWCRFSGQPHQDSCLRYPQHIPPWSRPCNSYPEPRQNRCQPSSCSCQLRSRWNHAESSPKSRSLPHSPACRSFSCRPPFRSWPVP